MTYMQSSEGFEECVAAETIGKALVSVRGVVEFNTPTGSFSRIGSQWIESPPYAPGQYFTFEETGRDGTYVYLTDRSRVKDGDPSNPMIVRLPLAGGPVHWSYTNPQQWSQFTSAQPAVR